MTKKEKRITSREVFRKFIVRNAITGELDATGMFSKECFEYWLRTRMKPPSEGIRAYHSAVRNVVTGNNGAKGFSWEEEAAVLRYLRQANPHGWPCFEGKTLSGSFGWKTVVGYNEKKQADLTAGIDGDTLNHMQTSGTAAASSGGVHDFILSKVSFDVYNKYLYLGSPEERKLLSYHNIPSLF